MPEVTKTARGTERPPSTCPLRVTPADYRMTQVTSIVGTVVIILILVGMGGWTGLATLRFGQPIMRKM